MAKKFNDIIDEVLKGIPKSVDLKLPKLKKVGNENTMNTKLKLPKLKRVSQ